VLGTDLIGKALEVLKARPLCDRCLGRLFAGLGYGWSNLERGAALKKVIVMGYHERIREGDEGALREFGEVAGNIGVHASSLYRLLFDNELEVRECSLCGGRLDDFIEEVAVRGSKLLSLYNVSRFVVGVRVPRGLLELEESIALQHGLRYWESIRSEIRREVGKAIQSRFGLKVDFEDPEAMLVVSYPDLSIEVIISSLYIRGRYWKVGRMISQAYWPTVGGARYYSIEQALYGILEVLGGESVVLHASGREDVDARMLGSGRPVIVEVKAPRVRRPDLSQLERVVRESSGGLIMVKLEGLARRRDVKAYKEEVAVRSKVYRALVAVDGGVSPEDLRVLELLNGVTVLQRTPKRVLHRRRDIVRSRKLYEVKCRPIAGPLVECLIRASGGLYVKELVNGDDGRTKPSFTEVLGRRAECLELDVLYVEEHPALQPLTQQSQEPRLQQG
jgi:tRNA pseudouridine synthase 10